MNWPSAGLVGVEVVVSVESSVADEADLGWSRYEEGSEWRKAEAARRVIDEEREERSDRGGADECE